MRSFVSLKILNLKAFEIKFKQTVFFSTGASWVEACRAFHILGWLTCIACIVFWALILAGIFENRVGYIVIISLTSGCRKFE